MRRFSVSLIVSGSSVLTRASLGATVGAGTVGVRLDDVEAALVLLPPCRRAGRRRARRRCRAWPSCWSRRRSGSRSRRRRAGERARGRRSSSRRSGSRSCSGGCGSAAAACRARCWLGESGDRSRRRRSGLGREHDPRGHRRVDLVARDRRSARPWSTQVVETWTSPLARSRSPTSIGSSGSSASGARRTGDAVARAGPACEIGIRFSSSRSSPVVANRLRRLRTQDSGAGRRRQRRRQARTRAGAATRLTGWMHPSPDHNTRRPPR